jgi:hypothetical protein
MFGALTQGELDTLSARLQSAHDKQNKLTDYLQSIGKGEAVSDALEAQIVGSLYLQCELTDTWRSVPFRSHVACVPVGKYFPGAHTHEGATSFFA